METYIQPRRGLFDGLKVPVLDLNAIFLCSIAIVIWQLGVTAISMIGSTEVGLGQISGGDPMPLTKIMLANLLHFSGLFEYLNASKLGLPTQPQSLHLAYYLAFFGWTFSVWAFFSAAVNRIAAMKLAREEGLSMSEALKFGASKFLPNLYSILSLGVFIGLLYGFCNSVLAGYVASIPYFGEILLVALYFLVLISSFLIVFTVALGLLGFNMSSSAIATEDSDAFDGLSRSINYILSRPWAFIVANLSIVAYITIFMFFGNFFLRIAVSSLSIGDVGLGHKEVVIDDKAVIEKLMTKGTEASTYKGDTLILPGKAKYLYNRIILGGSNNVGVYYQLKARKTTDGTVPGERRFRRHYLQQQADGTVIDVLPAIKNTSFLYQTGEALNIWILVCQLLMLGYSLNYFLAGQTTIYFMLRKEIDGDEYEEISLGHEDGDDLFNLPQYPPKPPAPPSGPSGGDKTDDKGKDDDGGKSKSLPMVMEV